MMQPDTQQILIVEDSPTQAAKLQYLLEKNGYTTTTARDGQEALQFLRNSAPVIVISDVLMPGMNGFELCRKIKSEESLKDTAVILLTALGNPEDVINGLTSGADNFLTKPYSESFLLARVESVLVNKEIRRAKPADGGVEIFYGGKKYHIDAKRHQIIDLLLSTFENVIQKNQELEQANKDLTIAQRKLQASEERLQKQTTDLARANRELESFSYSASHDLRQPLRTISSFTEILHTDYRETMPEEAQEYLSRIVKASSKMDQLIQDLLDLSRVTRHQFMKVDTDVSTMAQSIIQELQSQAPERKVRFSIQPNMHQLADPSLLRQVLTNLLGNAWKYTSNTPQPEISLQRSDEGSRMVYTVRDNGAGFDSGYRNKLFQPFSRLHSESEFKGTGVGLAIVKRIIERHDGEVWAEGEKGTGAAFSFALPR